MANSQWLRLWLGVCVLNSVLPGARGCVCHRPFRISGPQTQILPTMTNTRLNTLSESATETLV